MYTIRWRMFGQMLHVDVQGEWPAQRMWDVLAATFDMVSTRP